MLEDPGLEPRLCCDWKTLGYKISVSIILCKPCQVFAVAGRLRATRPATTSSWRTRRGSWCSERAHLMCRQGRCWKTRAWSWSQDKCFPRSLLKILRKPCRDFAVAGRLRATRPASASSWRTRRATWSCERAHVMWIRWRTRAWSWSHDK